MKTTLNDSEAACMIRAVERTFRSRVAALSIKPKSARCLTEQAAYLAGAMAAINAILPNGKPETLSEFCPPRWVITIMTGRSILDLDAYDPKPEPAAALEEVVKV